MKKRAFMGRDLRLVMDNGWYVVIMGGKMGETSKNKYGCNLWGLALV